MWGWGSNWAGILGINNTVNRSSPVQIPGTWKSAPNSTGGTKFAVKTDGTAYFWGSSNDGYSGINLYEPKRSSPTQLHGGGTTYNNVTFHSTSALAVKTDGTLWGWGNNIYGLMAIGTPDTFPQGTPGKSAPIQIGNQTNWKYVTSGTGAAGGLFAGMKTDGTLWTWGGGPNGGAGNNTVTPANAGYSSPVQIPGTDWHSVSIQHGKISATKQI